MTSLAGRFVESRSLYSNDDKLRAKCKHKNATDSSPTTNSDTFASPVVENPKASSKDSIVSCRVVPLHFAASNYDTALPAVHVFADSLTRSSFQPILFAASWPGQTSSQQIG
ncbi:unnamed protein product [Ceratitis capitata]|uniref:(Mediterranean fruit fly) hypothetical protein n=1 Tax=Ceratitis capitata TaxID=7213 RepID=A0A811VHC5_CERCA|nr:unnamed protein product [Ceratitis capitata]